MILLFNQETIDLLKIVFREMKSKQEIFTRLT